MSAIDGNLDSPDKVMPNTHGILSSLWYKFKVMLQSVDVTPNSLARDQQSMYGVGNDPYVENGVLYRLPPGKGDPDASVGGGWGQQAQNRRNVVSVGGGDLDWYNPGLGCFRAFHYGERPLPGRVYSGYIPPRGFSEWLR